MLFYHLQRKLLLFVPGEQSCSMISFDTLNLLTVIGDPPREERRLSLPQSVSVLSNRLDGRLQYLQLQLNEPKSVS